MIRLEPRSFKLGDTIPIWVRPNEDVSLHVDFPESVIDNTKFRLALEELDWPYMPSSYQKFERIEIENTQDNVVFKETKLNEYQYRVSVIIPVDIIKSLRNRVIDLQLIGERDGRTWVIADGTLTVAQGD